MWICCGHWPLLKIPKKNVLKAVYKSELVLKKRQGGIPIPSQLWPGSRHDFPPSFFSFNTSSADMWPGKPHRIHRSFKDSGSTIMSLFLGRREMMGERKQPGKKNPPFQAVLSSENSDILQLASIRKCTLLKITFLCWIYGISLGNKPHEPMQVILSISTRGFSQLQIFINMSPVTHSAQVKANPVPSLQMAFSCLCYSCVI